MEVSTFSLVIEDYMPRTRGGNLVWKVVTILINGKDLLAEPRDIYMGAEYNPEAATNGAIGWHPRDILGKNSPLLPQVPPRRVAVYMESAGEVNGGCRAPIISSEGDFVVWRDVRCYTAVFISPTEVEPEYRDDGVDLGGIQYDMGLPTFWFDKEKYVAEISRVTDEYWNRPASN